MSTPSRLVPVLVVSTVVCLGTKYVYYILINCMVHPEAVTMMDLFIITPDLKYT